MCFWVCSYVKSTFSHITIFCASIDKILKLLIAISQSGCTGLGEVQCSAEPGLERSLVQKKIKRTQSCGPPIQGESYVSSQKVGSLSTGPTLQNISICASVVWRLSFFS